MNKLILSLFLLLSFAWADSFRDAMMEYKNGNFVHAKELFELSIKKRIQCKDTFTLGKCIFTEKALKPTQHLLFPT